ARPECLELSALELQEVDFFAVCARIGDRPRIRRDRPHQDFAERCLAASGLPDQPEAFTVLYVEADAVDCGKLLLLGGAKPALLSSGERLPEVASGDERLCADPSRPGLPSGSYPDRSSIAPFPQRNQPFARLHIEM